MAVLKKTLFAENLEKYSVLIQDTDPNSKYFKITELSDTFTGGKNAFLIQGSEFLVPDTIIKIEIKDSKGNIIYHEPGEGIVSSSVNGENVVTEYYEGTSKVVSVYIYPDTAFGPCTITILGEISEYTDSNGLIQPIPLQYKDTYNVRWQKVINVNPLLPNTTKIRFYKRPVPNITETVQPIYQIISGSKVSTGINQSFANIKLSNLETFAGDVKRVKVFRTSEGDISDFDLIQDILIESKELLTTFDLTSSVVGRTGIFSNGVLDNFWDTGSLVAELTSSRVESGLKISGSGILKHIPTLNLNQGNTYELGIDAFYSGSESNNLSVLIGSGSVTSSIFTLSGISPTKNLLDTTFQFELDKSYPSGTLYFSQSAGEWHIGNVSLRLSQDTAFSPDEISFITTMPTVVGNETYNFKFEFYDVNNNYVPVFVTQSALFTGGTTLSSLVNTIDSSSFVLSSSLYAVSQSISGTVTFNSASTQLTITSVSSSISGSIITLSGSVSGSITSLSGSVSGSITSLSSSVSGSITTLSGSVSGSLYTLSGSVSGSLYSLSGSVSTSLANVSASISTSLSTANSQSIFTTLSASAYLDRFIFTDANGKLKRPPTASADGLYTGNDHLGFYSESVWKTYMDSQGDFYLTSSAANGGFLAWSSAQGRLQILGDINIQGGNAATTASLNSATSSLLNSINSATQSLSSSLYNSIFTNQSGQINKPPSVTVGSPSGLYLGSTFMGYYNGSDWKTYMANNGNFFLSGAGTDSLSWSSGVLTINGAINITGGNLSTQMSAIGSATGSLQNQLTGVGSATGSLQSQVASAGSVSSSVFTNSSGLINKTPSASSAGLYLGSTFMGYYNGTAWRTYMANNGNFFLSGDGTDSLSWSGGVLTINGAINITGGNLSTQLSAIGSTTGSLQNQLAGVGSATGSLQSQVTSAGSVSSSVFTNSAGLINKTPSASTAGLYLGSTFLGYYNGTAWRTYMDNAGKFFLTGGGTNSLSWDGTTLSIRGTIKVDDGTEVTSATVTGAAAGATALQSGQTGKSLGLTGGSVGGVTIASTKIYVGTGTHGNANTGFYVDSDGKMSLKDKLVWDGTTLSITGNITVSGGNAATTNQIDTVTAAVTNASASAATAQATANTKITAGGAAADVNSNTTTISGGKIRTGVIESTGYSYSSGDFSTTGTQINLDNGLIRSKNFLIDSSGNAKFQGKVTAEEGNIAGWVLGPNALSKATGSFTLRLTSTATSPGLVITQTVGSENFDRLRINADLNIPAISVSDTGSINYSNNSETLAFINDSSNPPYVNSQYGPVLGDGGSYDYGTGTFGIIGLQYATEEIFVEAEQFPNITNVIDGDGGQGDVFGYWDCYLEVTKYPSSTDALNQTNPDTTFGYNGTQVVLLASSYFDQIGANTPFELNNIYGGTIKAPGGGGINTPGAANWYRVQITQYYSANVNGNYAFLRIRRPNGMIQVKFGRVGNGYSVFSPGGIQVYQGFKNYMNAADVSSKAAGLDAEAAAAVNFFEVKGKSGIIGSLSVSSGLTVPKGKQFKIQHPKNPDKWLYHTALESPRADLIYRGVCELNEGFASCSIDSASRMEEGTFYSFTKNPQLFLQNDSGFDRLKGNVVSGSVQIYSENNQSTDVVSWMVVAERNDKDITESPLYDKYGNYRPERFNEKYIDERKQYLKNLTSGSI